MTQSYTTLESKSITKFQENTQNTHGLAVSNSCAMAIHKLIKDQGLENETDIKTSYNNCIKELKKLKDQITESELQLAIDNIIKLTEEDPNQLDIVKLYLPTKTQNNKEEKNYQALSDKYEIVIRILPLYQVLTLVYNAIFIDTDQKNFKDNDHESRKLSFFNCLKKLRSHPVCHHGTRNELIFLLNRIYKDIEILEDPESDIRSFYKEKTNHLYWKQYNALNQSTEKKELYKHYLAWMVDSKEIATILKVIDKDETYRNQWRKELFALFLKNGINPNAPEINFNKTISEVLSSLDFAVSTNSSTRLMTYIAIQEILNATCNPEQKEIHTALEKIQSWIKTTVNPENSKDQGTIRNFNIVWKAFHDLRKYRFILSITSTKVNELSSLHDECIEYFKAIIHDKTDHNHEKLQEKIDLFNKEIESCKKDAMITWIENFFYNYLLAVREFDDTRIENLYKSLLNSTTIEKILLDDKQLLEMSKSAPKTETQAEITPYQINRIFLHAIILHPGEWTDLFYKEFKAVLGFVNNNLLGEEKHRTSKLTEDQLKFINNSFNQTLLAQLNYLDKIKNGEIVQRPDNMILTLKNVKSCAELRAVLQHIDIENRYQAYQTLKLKLNPLLTSVDHIWEIVNLFPEEHYQTFIKNCIGYVKLIPLVSSVEHINRIKPYLPSILDVLGKEKVNTLINNSDDLFSFLSLYNENDRIKLLTDIINKEKINLLCQSAQQIIAILKVLNNSDRIQFIKTFIGIDKLIKLFTTTDEAISILGLIINPIISSDSDQSSERESIIAYIKNKLLPTFLPVLMKIIDHDNWHVFLVEIIGVSYLASIKPFAVYSNIFQKISNTSSIKSLLFPKLDPEAFESLEDLRALNDCFPNDFYPFMRDKIGPKKAKSIINSISKLKDLFHSVCGWWGKDEEQIFKVIIIQDLLGIDYLKTLIQSTGDIINLSKMLDENELLSMIESQENIYKLIHTEDDVLMLCESSTIPIDKEHAVKYYFRQSINSLSDKDNKIIIEEKKNTSEITTSIHKPTLNGIHKILNRFRISARIKLFENNLSKILKFIIQSKNDIVHLLKLFPKKYRSYLISKQWIDLSPYIEYSYQLSIILKIFPKDHHFMIVKSILLDNNEKIKNSFIRNCMFIEYIDHIPKNNRLYFLSKTINQIAELITDEYRLIKILKTLPETDRYTYLQELIKSGLDYKKILLKYNLLNELKNLLEIFPLHQKVLIINDFDVEVLKELIINEFIVSKLTTLKLSIDDISQFYNKNKYPQDSLNIIYITSLSNYFDILASLPKTEGNELNKKLGIDTLLASVHFDNNTSLIDFFSCSYTNARARDLMLIDEIKGTSYFQSYSIDTILDLLEICYRNAKKYSSFSSLESIQAYCLTFLHDIGLENIAKMLKNDNDKLAKLLSFLSPDNALELQFELRLNETCNKDYKQETKHETALLPIKNISDLYLEWKSQNIKNCTSYTKYYSKELQLIMKEIVDSKLNPHEINYGYYLVTTGELTNLLSSIPEALRLVFVKDYLGKNAITRLISNLSDVLTLIQLFPIKQRWLLIRDYSNIQQLKALINKSDDDVYKLIKSIHIKDLDQIIKYAIDSEHFKTKITTCNNYYTFNRNIRYVTSRNTLSCDDDGRREEYRSIHSMLAILPIEHISHLIDTLSDFHRIISILSISDQLVISYDDVTILAKKLNEIIKTLSKDTYHEVGCVISHFLGSMSLEWRLQILLLLDKNILKLLPLKDIDNIYKTLPLNDCEELNNKLRINYIRKTTDDLLKLLKEEKDPLTTYTNDINQYVFSMDDLIQHMKLLSKEDRYYLAKKLVKSEHITTNIITSVDNLTILLHMLKHEDRIVTLLEYDNKFIKKIIQTTDDIYNIMVITDPTPDQTSAFCKSILGYVFLRSLAKSEYDKEVIEAMINNSKQTSPLPNVNNPNMLFSQSIDNNQTYSSNSSNDQTITTGIHLMI